VRKKTKPIKKKSAAVDEKKMLRFFNALSRAVESLNKEERKRVTAALAVLYS